MISPWRNLCGVAEHSRRLVPALERLGIETSVAEIDTDLIDRLGPSELSVEFGRLFEEAAASSDVVHVQHEYRLMRGRASLADSLSVLREIVVAATDAQKPLFITWHSLPPRALASPWRVGTWLSANREWRRLMNALNDSLTTTSVVQARFALEALRRAGSKTGNTTVIRPGVTQVGATRLTDGEAAARREALGIPNDARVIVMFGFVTPYKGHSTALAALQRLDPSYHLLIAGGQHPLGDGAAIERIKHQVAAMPALSGRVHVTGHLDDADVGPTLAVADVCVAPYEPWAALTGSGAVGIVLASGKPVIASALPLFEEMHAESGCLELVPPGDSGALANAIRDLVADGSRRMELAKAAAEYCRRFSWDAVAAEHARAYAAVAQSKSQMPLPAEN
jgi:glycosyltransferase involved in cell wall biosynthesis